MAETPAPALAGIKETAAFFNSPGVTSLQRDMSMTDMKREGWMSIPKEGPLGRDALREGIGNGSLNYLTEAELAAQREDEKEA